MKVDVTMGGLPVYVTSHAVYERLRQRFQPLDEYELVPEGDDETGWLDKMAALLRDVRLDVIDPVHRVKRLINNDFVPVEYYRNDRYDLRFVVHHDTEHRENEPDGRLVVLTVEKPYENQANAQVEAAYHRKPFKRKEQRR